MFMTLLLSRCFQIPQEGYVHPAEINGLTPQEPLQKDPDFDIKPHLKVTVVGTSLQNKI